MFSMSDAPLHHRTIGELARDFRSGELSPVELTEHLLERIETLEPLLGAFRRVCPERAVEQARTAENELRAGEDRGPLLGIPLVVKDLFDVAGLPTTAGTTLLEDNVAQQDATAVERLTAAGMVLLGKTNTVQFAYGGAGINHDHGTPHNPWHETPHLPGGSSSGTGVAVAAGLAPAGLGTDTGGSVRIPASFCGITGLKTPVGHVSRAGVWPLSWSLDSVGPLARSVEDAARVYQVMQGDDPRDPTTRGRSAHDVTQHLDAGVRGRRIAFAETAFWDDVDAEVASAVRACGPVFADLGARVDSIDFPQAQQALDLNPRGLVIAAEAYTLNRRFVDEQYDRLDPVVASRIRLGRDVAAHEYLHTSREWQRLRAEADAALRDVDAVLCPTTMIPPLPIAQADADAGAYTRTNLQCLRNTSIGNLLDLCGLSVPCGFTRGGLPIGLAIYGRSRGEETVLQVGHAFQQATDWHRRHPDLA